MCVGWVESGGGGVWSGWFGRRVAAMVWGGVNVFFRRRTKKLPVKINLLGGVIKKIKKNALLSENIALLNFSVTHS